MLSQPFYPVKEVIGSSDFELNQFRVSLCFHYLEYVDVVWPPVSILIEFVTAWVFTEAAMCCWAIFWFSTFYAQLWGSYGHLRI